MERRHGFVVQTELTHADGYAERAAAFGRHLSGSTRRVTLDAD